MKKPVAVACTVLVCANAASAAPIISDFSWPFPVPGSVDLTLPSFDPARGRLESVFMVTYIGFQGDAWFVNLAPEPLSDQVRLRLIAALHGRGWFMIAGDVFFDVQTGPLPPGEPAVVHFSGVAADAKDYGAEFPGGPFIGTGGVSATLGGSAFEATELGYGFLEDVTGQIDWLRVETSYRYHPGVPIPEPGTALLLGLGLATLLARRRY